MNEEPEEKTQLEKLYEWCKEDEQAQEGLIALLASVVVFCFFVIIIWAITQLILL
jgi:hypothetical protein